MSQAKQWYWLWCTYMSFCKTLTVVERQPFRLYSQRRASKWNGERFIKSCVSFAHWKRFTRGFPVDGRLPASFWQYQRIPKNLLDKEVGNAGLPYRQTPAPKDGNCLFHAMHDQLVRLGRVVQSATKLRSDLVNYPRSNPATPDGTHFSEFSGHGTLICEEWLWMVNGVTGLLYGA